jgi:omega-6 fatty acid desaturase (delta-12 desaturase)
VVRTGKELIVATKEFAVEDRAKSWFYTLSTLFLMLACLAGTVWNVHVAGKVLCSLLSFLFITRMFVIYHDHQHHAILHHSKAAKALFTVFGMYTLAPTSIWKRSHDYHHSHNSKLYSASIGSYPIMTREKFRGVSAAEQRRYLLIRHPLTMALGYFTMFVYGMCIRSFLSSKSRHLDSLLALVLHIAFLATLWMFLGWQGVLLTGIIPFLLTFALGAYLFYAQHNFPGVTFREKQDWTYDDASLHSSSYMKMNAVMRWATANIGYHHVHHLNSRIPFYRLPEAMSRLPELQQPVMTRLTPREMIRCLRLKLWDAERNRMITLSEI